MIISTLIEKGLGSTRVGTRGKTLEILIEMVSADCAEPVIAELGNFGSNKQAKLASSAINAVTEVLRYISRSK
jgi:cytoskeleton-associated protein 5